MNTEMIRNEIYNDLFNKALDMGLGVINAKLDPRTKSSMNFKRQLIFMNTNYRKQTQLPFQLAHEIGHFINGDDFGKTVFFSPAIYGYEGQANETAIKLLLEYYLSEKSVEYVNIANFMNFFCIPTDYDQIIRKQIIKYYSVNS